MLACFIQTISVCLESVSCWDSQHVQVDGLRLCWRIVSFFIIPSTLCYAPVLLALKTAPELPPPCLTASEMFLCMSGHCGQTTRYMTHLTMIFFFQKALPLFMFFLCQLQFFLELESVDFGAGVSFLDDSLPIHGRWKNLFQFPVHGKHVLWVVLDHTN